MFGLNNYGGSCWVNACLQGIFRIPELIARYNGSEEPANPLDNSLLTIWRTKGTEGLKDLFDAIRTEKMPAGHGIGDSNEAPVYICDKLPLMEKLCSFKVTEKVECSCGFSNLKEDTQIQFSLFPSGRTTLTQTIFNAVKEEVLDSWKCDKCESRGTAKKSFFMSSFPKVLIFKFLSESLISFPVEIVINSYRYHLLSILYFNGGHWWTTARNIDEEWVTYNDNGVSRQKIPSSKYSNMLIYYRVNE